MTATVERARPAERGLRWRMLVLLHIVLVLELCDLHGGLKYLEISYFKGQPTNLW